MKESEKEEKEKPSEKEKASNLNPVEEALEEIRKRIGNRLREGKPEEGFTVIFNPPQYLVEQMSRAKKEQAAKKKK